MKRIKGEKCMLWDLRVGQLCKVLNINIEDNELKNRLLEMGLVPKTVVKIKKKPPFGEPVIIQLRGYEMFLGKRESKRILVEVI